MLTTRVYGDSQQIIAQVLTFSAAIDFLARTQSRFCFHMYRFVQQGDLADCFYIVESGQVRITMKRSRVFFLFNLNTWLYQFKCSSQCID